LRINKEQESNLILPEHDDDGDDGLVTAVHEFPILVVAALFLYREKPIITRPNPLCKIYITALLVVF